MTREKRPVRAPFKWLAQDDRHPFQDAANVHVNDPLAVGIEELRGPFHGFIHRKPATKENKMNSKIPAEKISKARSIAFTFEAPAAQLVSLAGDFNNWDTMAAPMHVDADGMWHLRVPLKPGRYEYRFVADGVWRDDPTAQQRTANALGGENCVKIVKE